MESEAARKNAGFRTYALNLGRRSGKTQQVEPLKERNSMSVLRMWTPGILGWVLAVGVSGCGGSSDGLPREAVSGSVTFDGQPLAKGTIQFDSASDKLPTTGMATINDGKYTIHRAEGLVPGTYKVVIASFTEVAETKLLHGVPGKPAPAPKNLVSKLYNRDSKLTAEVKEGQPNEFNFEVKKIDATEELESSGKFRSRRAGPGPRG
jgi:hypothetical protein